MFSDERMTREQLVKELEEVRRRIGELESREREQKRTEEALRKSNELHRILFSEAGDALLLTSADGRILNANKKACESLGYSLQELQALAISDIDADWDPQAVSGVVADQLASGQAITIEGRQRRKDRSLFPVEVRSQVTVIDGEPQFIASCRDITERKWAEKELRESEELAKACLNATADMVYLLDPDGTVLTANDPAARSLGKTADELIGTNVFDSFPPELAKSRREMGEKVVQTGKSVRFQDEREGRIFDVSIHPTFDAQGEVGRLAVFACDISERKQAEKALMESERLLHEAQAMAQVGHWRIHPETGEVEGSNELFHIFGLSREEATLDAFLEAVHPEDRQYNVDHITRGVEHGESWDIEHRLIAKDGAEKHVHAIGEAVFDEAGNVASLVGTVQDITERWRAEEERRSLETQVQHSQKLESLGVLAGGIAHDFNNLLMTILGNADLALLDLSPVSPVRPNIQDIEGAARQAAELAKQMLAYSGRGHFVVAPLDLSEVVGEMAYLLESSISKKAKLTRRLDSHLPATNADAAQIQQVVMNLITNASEAIGEGEPGIITVLTGVQECSSAYLATSFLDEKQAEGSYVYVEVTDTGCGMAEETKSTLFDPFFTTKFTGRGLGLAAVLGIVRGHSGAIMVDTELGKGSTFRVLLPAATQEAITRGSTGDLTKRDGWRGRGVVLVVDDEESVRRLAVMMVRRLGFETLEAADGQEAVEVFRKNADAITCVLLDLTMPHMDGGEACLEIQQLRDDASIVLSSGYDEAELSERFDGYGMEGFIQKPYQFAKLADVLQTVLEKKHSVDENGMAS